MTVDQPSLFDAVLPSRLASKIDGIGTAGCWVWLAGANGAGYGYVRLEGRNLRAHRVVYELLVGPIPDGLQLDHLCRVPRCVNPAHLEPVTPRENTLRGEGLAARNARVTHCAAGHPYDTTNTYLRPDGARGCRTCIRASDRAYKARRRAATS